MRSPLDKHDAEKIATVLYTQDYDRTFCIEEACAKELTTIEYVVLVIHRFWSNIYINGFDGFEANTDAVYSHFLPIALAEIGAVESSTISRRAISEKRKEPDNRTNIDNAFFECQEDLGALFHSYVEKHRDELPPPPDDVQSFSADWRHGRERRSRIRQNGTPELIALWANKNRPCPRCGTIFVSKFARGACPKCRHVFVAGRDS